MKLIVTEKPAVARDIASVLGIRESHTGYKEGNGFVITWAFGHLIEHCQPDEYHPELKEWTLETLPILPSTFKKKVIPQSADQCNTILTLFKRTDLTSVICATDAGREGELIFRQLYAHAQSTLPIERLWISSQTDQAIKSGFSDLKPGSDFRHLYYSARCRAEADWLVGINATRAYTLKFSRGHGVLSVGRVQTPVLKLIVDRYRAHHAFVRSPFYDIELDVSHKNGSFTALYVSADETRVTDKQVAMDLKKNLETHPNGTIATVDVKKIIEKQPLLYDLTTLQKDANTQFGYSANDTLSLAQALYERHKLISYPRTSSRYISDDIAKKLPTLLQAIATIAPYSDSVAHIIKQQLTMAQRMINNKKITDHHAIIPTEKQASLAPLNPQESQLYLLILQRFLASFYPECEKEHTHISLSLGAHRAKASGTVIKKPGWRALYQADKPDKKSEQLLPIVSPSDPITLTQCSLKKSQTKAPALYTEASILAAMETAGKDIDDEDARQAMKECGLGTPATRAQLLEKLITVGYITRDKNRLVPTQKGEHCIDCLQDTVLSSAELTGKWEKKLHCMATGTEDRDTFMSHIRTLTKDMIQTITQSTAYALHANQEVFGTCPACNKGKVIEMKQSYSCTKWKETGCRFVIWKELAQKKITPATVKTLLKKGKTACIKGFKRKDGRDFSAHLILAEEPTKVCFEFVQEKLGGCTLCKGTIIETAQAYSCNHWKETGCAFVIWKKIAQRSISLKEAKQLIETGQTDILTGFKNRQGRSFKAALQLQNGTVSFVKNY